MKVSTSPSPTFIQPTEFNALDHEKKFKFILAGLFFFIIVYVCGLAWAIWQFDEAGGLFSVGPLQLTGDLGKTQEAGMSTLVSWVFRGNMGVTALSMLTSTACGVYANRGFVTPPPNPPSAPIRVNIPFSTLNFAIALGIVVAIVLNLVFNLEGIGGLFMSSVLLGFLLCNKKARKYVALCLRQLIDRFTVGGNDSFDPIVSLALVVRALIERFTVGGHNSVAPIVSIAVVEGDQVAPPRQLATRGWGPAQASRWAMPSERYAVTLPEFLNVMDVTETSM